MQTRDQKYSIDAYKNMLSVKEHSNEISARRYGAMCHKLPLLIHAAGLAQALAFVESRVPKEKVYETFLDNLGHTIGEHEKLAKMAREAELNDYMRLTTQIMEALVWYKRFAQSILGVDASDTEDEVG